ncbi:MAG TPA: hypothetical protein VLJ21_04150 [Candidatus Binatia bacterium]|nr:hypothetical protein [Candidatus Binatia bacterium]
MELRSPLILLLLLGIGLGFSIPLPVEVVSAVSLLFLALVAFESVVRIKLHALDTMSLRMLKWVVVFTVFKLLAFSFAGQLLGLPVQDAVLLATLLLSVGGSHPFLALESTWASPLATLLPFVVLSFRDPAVPGAFLDQFLALALRMVTSIGVGIFGGVLLLSAMHRIRNTFHALASVIAAVIVFIVTTLFGGFGLIGVAALGLFIGNTGIKKTLSLEGPVLDVVGVIGVIVLGMSVTLPRTQEFIVLALALLAISVVIRLLALAKVGKDILPLALAPRGLPMVAVLLALAPVAPQVVALGTALLVGYDVLALVGKHL